MEGDIMHNSIRYEIRKHPYWELPLKEERKRINRRLRATVKQEIKKHGDYAPVKCGGFG
jgi:hypothetical protein